VSAITILNVDATTPAGAARSRTLTQAGYTIAEARTGAEALRLVHELMPQLVICDVTLSDMSGTDACRQIKADPLTRGIPVLHTSATCVSANNAQVTAASGAEIYLTEPVEPLELTTVVRVLLRLHHIEREALEREAAFQREQAARKQAEDATRLKDEFFANVSHELRTPMNAIIGWAHLLRTGRLDDTQRPRALESIDRGARTQARLIEDLLDVSRIVSGKLVLERQPVNLAAVVAAAVESQRAAAQEKGLTLQTGAAPPNFTVLGDLARLQQVMQSLLSNAVKFTPSGGRIVLTLACIGAETCVSVADTGEGIVAERLPYLFDRFRQTDVTRAHGGLGLGLAIARHVVELHGGAIRAASEGAGRGATFTVTLPQAVDVEGTPRAPIAPTMPGNYGPKV